jgi:lipoprotein
MKKSLVMFMLLAMLSVFSCGCAKEKKFVGSKNTPGYNIDMQIYQSVDEIKDNCTAIVIASYSEDPIDFYEEEWDLHSSRYSLHIEKVLKGDLQEGNKVVFSQMGKPNDDDYETKIKKGKRYLLFLCQKDLESTKGEIIYDAAGVEQGIVEIKNNNKLYSYYDTGIMPEYDGKDLEKLENQIFK